MGRFGLVWGRFGPACGRFWTAFGSDSKISVPRGGYSPPLSVNRHDTPVPGVSVSRVRSVILGPGHSFRSRVYPQYSTVQPYVQCGRVGKRTSVFNGVRPTLAGAAPLAFVCPLDGEPSTQVMCHRDRLGWSGTFGPRQSRGTSTH